MKTLTAEDLEKIHIRFQELMKRGCFKTANTYIKDICLIQDKNVWRTCLLLLKGLKDRDEFKDTYQELLVKLPGVV